MPEGRHLLPVLLLSPKPLFCSTAPQTPCSERDVQEPLSTAMSQPYHKSVEASSHAISRYAGLCGSCRLERGVLS